uniref:RNA-directed RNA polymerase L n=1 Tax=Pirital mammarenavirus (isolate Rat/Venezuela/VAV-488/1995) TaxID=3052324 RepID=Q6XQI6_PIRVV|nr:L protein [Mammarenavirus piritalense]
MEEHVNELHDLVRKWVSDDENFAEQKAIFLSQTKLRAITIEGLKLLSTIVEVDSCQKNSCIHNREKTLNSILRDNKIVCPTLPEIVPDGYRLIGDVLILLEVFVRSNQESFEKKYEQDYTKLMQVKKDLQSHGITLVPMIDGRSSYYVEFMPDWVVEKIRWHLIKLMDLLKEDGESVEELEYERLVSSLSALENQSLGLESLLSIKERGIEYTDRLTKIMYGNLNNNMSVDECKGEILRIYQNFRQLFDQGQFNPKYRKTDREFILKTLREHGLIKCAIMSEEDSCKNCMIHMFKVLTIIKQSFVSNKNIESSFILKEYNQLLSVCNKVKSLKVLNTRRGTLMVLDLIMLNKLLSLIKIYGIKAALTILRMQCIPAVNDRLLSIDFLISIYERKMIKSPKWLEKVHGKLKRVVQDCMFKALEDYLVEIDFDTWFSIKDELLMTQQFKPSICYRSSKGCVCNAETLKNLSMMTEEDFLSYLKILSSLSLSLVNSMKTSSAPKSKINQANDFYGIVHCEEVYFQGFGDNNACTLLYQKTGEKSRCYSVAFSDNEQQIDYGSKISFYADPKRFFLPIMSQDVLNRMCNEMLSWLDFLSDDNIKVVADLLRKLILCVLCTPSKRVQVYLQGFRYLIMAYVNEIHCNDLFAKLEVDALTASERQVMIWMDDLTRIVLEMSKEADMAKSFKFILNLSYLCHLITKETPDRLTDQIKCFEKFLEPKLKFGSLMVNPDSTPELTSEQEDQVCEGLHRLLNKKIFSKCENIPGVSKELVSLCSSLFNSSNLEVKPLLNHDPLTPSFTSTALDLSSNKSVVVPKLNEIGETLTEYDFGKIVSSVVVDLTEHFKTKGKYKLDPRDLRFRIFKKLSSLVEVNPTKKSNRKSESGEVVAPDESFMDELTEEQQLMLSEIEVKVSKTFEGMSKDELNRKQSKEKGAEAHLKRLWSKEVRDKISSETSLHEVKDFDVQLFPFDTYEELVTIVFNDKSAHDFYFLEKYLNPCPLDMLMKNLTLKAFNEGDFFECFKYILIASEFDNKIGRYDHKIRTRLGLKDPALKIREEARISTRESNSESIAKRLDKSFFTNSSLRNLCFYSDESPTTRTGVATDVGKLKFGLSYKEQVGGNRELYVGDLNTKLITRLVEDYAESICSNMKYTCLNSESEFERALLDLKSVVRQGGFAVSMDHSKWGPHMSPAIFAQLLRCLKFRLKDGSEIDKKAVLNILYWHLHKIVEVPFNVVQAFMSGFVKRGLGLMDRGGATLSEEFMFGFFEKGVVPSHLSSVVDMGQGILHNMSDLYGLITEQFINYVLDFCYNVSMTSYTSSDDEIMLSTSSALNHEDGSLNVDVALEILEFHNFLSDKLNKFVSPKTVAGTFASEFKSRFFIWSQEVPLLTKFVAAALHNIKAKAPNQLAETVDTILDQCVANGVSIEIVGAISKRTNSLVCYSGHPLNPFLCLEESDVRDWVDGSRGYRLQRSIENIFPDDLCPNLIRDACRKVFHRIQSGKIEEEFLVASIQGSPDECLNSMLTIADVDEDIKKDLAGYRWLNLRAYGDLRLVLRTKLMSSTRTLQREEIPSLVRSVQSKLSKNFVRGAKRILTDAINKSAFQSCISSGFIGVCKSMGSKCVRDNTGGFVYIKEITKHVMPHTTSYCPYCKPSKNIYCEDALRSVSEYSRPIFWDYFSLVLSNACELGNWVFGAPILPKTVFHLDNPNHFWPIKPSSQTELEDKVGMNHVLYSIRRNYPSIFDEHISPYMSDLNMLRLSWVQKIKFLDLCVALDMSSECLGIISHIMRRKREELYIVKQQELSMSHTRESTNLESGLSLEPQEVCKNFLLQVLFDSMVNPVLLTTSQFRKYFWYGEVLQLPNDASHHLAQFTQFILDCKQLNSSRAMTLDDLDVGYVTSRIKRTTTFVALSTFITSLDWENRHEYKSFQELILSSPCDVFKFEFSMTFSHIRSSHKFRYERCTSYILKVHVVFDKRVLNSNMLEDQSLLITPHSVEYFVSQSGGNHISLDGVGLLPLDPLISGKEVLNIDDVLRHEDVNFSAESPLFSQMRFDFKPFLKELKNGFSYKLIGPDIIMEPLVLDKGQIKEGSRIVSQLKLRLDFKAVFVALGCLEEESRSTFISNLFMYIGSLRGEEHRISMTESNLVQLIDNYPQVFDSMLDATNDWLNCGSFSLCKSKSLGCVMIADERGPFKLKGVNCRRLLPDSQAVEID